MSANDPREEIELEVKRANGAPGITIIDTRIILRFNTQTIDQLISKVFELDKKINEPK